MIPRRVVLLHGFTQGGGIWVPVMESMTTRAAIDAPDLPGHGGASHVVSTLEGTASQLEQTYGTAAYVGYSMGGRVALHVALEYPQAVTHLVLCSATAGIDVDAERDARRKSDAQLADHIREIGTRAFVDEWTNQSMFATLKRTDLDDEIRLANPAEGLATSLETMGTGNQTPCWERLHELNMPVLVVTGANDAKFSALGNRLRESIGSNATHVELPDTGHAVPFERPAEFAALLSAFLR